MEYGGGRGRFEVSAYRHAVFVASLTGDPLRTAQHRLTAKQKHFGTTVPLQLVGQDWKPVSQLESQVKDNTGIHPTLPSMPLHEHTVMIIGIDVDDWFQRMKAVG